METIAISLSPISSKREKRTKKDFKKFLFYFIQIKNTYFRNTILFFLKGIIVLFDLCISDTSPSIGFSIVCPELPQVLCHGRVYDGDIVPAPSFFTLSVVHGTNKVRYMKKTGTFF